MGKYHNDKRILNNKEVQKRVNRVPQIRRVRRIHRIVRIMLVLITIAAFCILPWLGLIYVAMTLLISAALKKKYLEAIDEYIYLCLKEKGQQSKSDDDDEYEDDSQDEDECEDDYQNQESSAASVAGRAVASYAVGKAVQNQLNEVEIGKYRVEGEGCDIVWQEGRSVRFKPKCEYCGAYYGYGEKSMRLNPGQKRWGMTTKCPKCITLIILFSINCMKNVLRHFNCI